MSEPVSSSETALEKNVRKEKAFTDVSTQALSECNSGPQESPVAQRLNANLHAVLTTHGNTASTQRKVLRALRGALRSWQYAYDVRMVRSQDELDPAGLILAALHRGDPKHLGKGHAEYEATRCLTNILRDAELVTFALVDKIQEEGARFYINLRETYQKEKDVALMDDDSGMEEEEIGPVIRHDSGSSTSTEASKTTSEDSAANSSSPHAPIPLPRILNVGEENTTEEKGLGRGNWGDRGEVFPWLEAEETFCLELIVAHPALVRGGKTDKECLWKAVNKRFRDIQYTSPVTGVTIVRKDRTYEAVRQHFDRLFLEGANGMFTRLERYADVADTAGNTGLSIGWSAAARSAGVNVSFVRSNGDAVASPEHDEADFED